MALRHLANHGSRAHVRVEVLSLKPRIAATEVPLGVVLGATNVPCEKAAAERTEGNQTDAQLAQERKDARLEVALPERVLALQRGDRMHRMRAADGLLPRLRQSEKSHLPSLDQLRHHPHDLLDRHFGIDPMLIEKVDRLHTQPPQRSFNRSTNCVRPAGDAHRLPVLDSPAELRGDDHSIAFAGQSTAEQFLVVERPVHLGGIEERDAKLDGPVDGGDRLLLVRRSVALAEAHASEAKGGDLQLSSELARNQHACIL
jgi:hypothetical protein